MFISPLAIANHSQSTEPAMIVKESRDRHLQEIQIARKVCSSWIRHRRCDFDKNESVGGCRRVGGTRAVREPTLSFLATPSLPPGCEVSPSVMLAFVMSLSTLLTPFVRVLNPWFIGGTAAKDGGHQNLGVVSHAGAADAWVIIWRGTPDYLPHPEPNCVFGRGEPTIPTPCSVATQLTNTASAMNNVVRWCDQRKSSLPS